MRAIVPATVLALALAACANPVLAQGPEAEKPDLGKLDVEEQFVVSSEAFLAAHPDQRYRHLGFAAYGRGDHDAAIADFTRAARYSDKPAQSMLGDMYWRGLGAAQDRALAYAWMDLAAERGYPMLLAKRERFWRDMTDAERARSLEVGVALYDEFGDEVARPRLERELKRARRGQTGSRIGNGRQIVVHVPSPIGFRGVSGADFYQSRFWDAKQYFAWQDSDFRRQTLVAAGPAE